ncbi:anthranilate synthase component II [Microvirga terricola]|uniref:Aminodeoxychorismate/anthranilate synthase component II n=1 Tax=Microvirga terricola TaxID=2719797 RepID=A0ABX0VDG9_9HYPH|nr:aminodeoxychorismate/anthranilate synthase component II [Microvirga terricola]NIX77166.1 aminodeoxychorismate/anthranilate synthase component II [Microvirga terricola]
MTRVLVIDNYDSFTWNLVHLLAPLATSVDVVRNDAITTNEVLASPPDAIVLSPGPCTPNEAGICLDLVDRASRQIPTFGVCLGLQAIGQAFGGTVSRAPLPMHGKVSEVEHRGQTVFRGINGPFKATRYHSLIVDRETCPVDLTVTAETADGLVMGLSHRILPIHGVQFHPESILSEHGVTIMRNFFDLAAAWNAERQNRPS